MPTKHVTRQIEAYIDHRLTTEERRRVEKHLAVCPTCERRFFDAHRLAGELGPAIQTALGRPTPRPGLRQQVRYALAATQTPDKFSYSWAAVGRILNAAGTLAIIALLSLAVFAVVRGQLSGTDLAEIASLRPASNTTTEGGGAMTGTSIPTLHSAATATPVRKLSSLRETLPGEVTAPENHAGEEIPGPPVNPVANKQIEESKLLQQRSAGNRSDEQIAGPILPGGLIAFAFFNPASHRQVYETHLITPDGSDNRLFPLDGVSEPALRRTEDGYQIAFRAWSEPTSPRSLLSSNLDGERPGLIGGFWEDAQPDWSPTENRIIFASQREGDRRWRLYTIWGDGTAEVNLRREGKSPTFAPDGHRFAFESCDDTGNRCGLWVANLDNSEHGSAPFLEDPSAQAPDWSPVGEEIAYMANPDDNWDLYLVDSDGSNVRRLTTDPAIDGLPAWSPDGEWLAFLSDRGGNWGIWLLHVASGEVRRLYDFDGGTFTPPNRPPYGKRNWWDEQLSWSR